MELQNVIEKRQSVRKYKGGDIPDKDIEAIIAAAGLAPSGKNLQNWHFLVTKNKETMKEIGDVINAKNESLAKEMEKVDQAKADRWRKFYKNFTLFFENSAVFTIVYTREYLPSGYNELKLIDADPKVLEELVHVKNPGMQSLGAAMENFTLKAIDLGYGTCWLTSANYAAPEIEAYIKDKYGFEKEGWFMGCMIAMGVPEDHPKSPGKKSLEEIYTRLD